MAAQAGVVVVVEAAGPAARRHQRASNRAQFLLLLPFLLFENPFEKATA